MSRYRVQERRLGWILGIFLISLTLTESQEDAPSSHQSTPDSSTLKIKPRESEVSITLGKDLVLGPPSSTKSSIVANFSNFDGAATSRIDSLVSPTITSRVPSGKPSADIVRRPVSKDQTPRWPHIQDYRASKGSKIVSKRDSYLEALRHSHTQDDPRERVVRADLRPKTNRREYAPTISIYKPETEYGSPDTSYASKGPQVVYGDPSASSHTGDSYSQSFRPPMDINDRYAPQNSYGPPQNSYGPPSPSSHPQIPYGPPASSPPQQGYGTAVQTSPPAAIYSAPYALSDVPHISILPSFDLLGWPLALKLNAFTIAKIILKLVIFKMIVKFIAVICMLLFIPKLEIIKKKGNKDDDDDDDDDEERSLSSPYASAKTLNDLEAVVKSSVEKYEAHNGVRSGSTKKCTTLVCRATEALTPHESWDEYLNLFKSYVEEERRTVKREQ